MSTIRWGIAGPGRIAEKVVTDFVHVEDAEVVAVGSRSADRARAFADRHGISRAHGSYRALIDDPEVDVIYLATPHSEHRDFALAAIEAGKALLVEKSFTSTVAGAEQVVAAARDKGVFVMEAMWTRFQPAYRRLAELVADGSLGAIRMVQADLGAARSFDPDDRLFSPDLGGGAMLDLGVYVVSFAQSLLGTPSTIHTVGTTYDNGVDASFAMALDFDQRAQASLMGSFTAGSPGAAVVAAENGWVRVEPRFHHPASLTMKLGDAAPEQLDLPPIGQGYAHEFIEVTECLKAGKLESEVMPLDDTLAVQRIMNSACEQLGLHHVEGNVRL